MGKIYQWACFFLVNLIYMKFVNIHKDSYNIILRVLLLHINL